MLNLILEYDHRIVILLIITFIARFLAGITIFYYGIFRIISIILLGLAQGSSMRLRIVLGKIRGLVSCLIFIRM